jgi:hypothetical protein
MFRQEKRVCFSVGGQQGLDFNTQRWILGTGLVKKGVSFIGLAFQCSPDNFFNS